MQMQAPLSFDAFHVKVLHKNKFCFSRLILEISSSVYLLWFSGK